MQERTQKTVYAYHPETSEYLGSTMADLSPLDLEETWLIPAYATEQQPPKAGNRQAVVYRDGGWQLAEDFRALKLWSKASAQPVTAQIGDTPDSLQATELEPPIFAVWNKKAWKVDADAQRAALTAQAQQELQQRLAAAYAQRRPLEDAQELGLATAQEQGLLTVWKRYCVELSRLQQLTAWPQLAETDWPAAPA
ncbi:tail fiber assembly protein [Chromobacterium haemolyticum]|uniref:tail fiber assembly protein n=1 Tax=Chromobacterium haemolyticum TaxID=394935 RepID=UPI00244A8EE9|nr:tail fiber assembly protein [Chromobacterium haemolyticum]MDH0341350.1 tail fiber assembly protein [Chromobacterium haemolyticum]